MAIEIIPKRAFDVPSKINYLFYFVLFLLVVALIIWFVLGQLIENSELLLAGTEKALSGQKTEERDAIEKEVLSYQKKFKDFSFILNSHQINSNFFKFLESVVHPQISFLKLELDSANAQATLSGKTNSFEALGQQILILKEQEVIKSAKISLIKLAKEGGIEFSITFSFAPDFLLFKKTE